MHLATQDRVLFYPAHVSADANDEPSPEVDGEHLEWWVLGMRRRSVCGTGLQAVSRMLRVLSRERPPECLGFWRQTARSPHSHTMCYIRTRSQGTSATNWGLMGGVKEVACSSLASIFKRLFLARYLERREDLCILVDILHVTIRNRNHSGYCK